MCDLSSGWAVSEATLRVQQHSSRFLGLLIRPASGTHASFPRADASRLDKIKHNRQTCFPTPSSGGNMPHKSRTMEAKYDTNALPTVFPFCVK